MYRLARVKCRWQGNITKLAIDAVTNAANPRCGKQFIYSTSPADDRCVCARARVCRLEAGGGISGAIFAAAGVFWPYCDTSFFHKHVTVLYPVGCFWCAVPCYMAFVAFTNVGLRFPRSVHSLAGVTFANIPVAMMCFPFVSIPWH